MTDLIATALESARVRAWLAKCATLPPPPELPAPYRKFDPIAHEAAIAAALERGATSLQEYRAMPRIALATAPARADNGRAQCAVCGLSLPRAHPAHPICASCAAEPDATRARIEGRITAARRRAQEAIDAYQRAVDALPAGDVPKWDKIAAALMAAHRVGPRAGTMRPEQAAWIEKVKRAIDTPTNTQVSDAIRLAYYADESRYWTVEGAADAERRARLALAQFEECVEALEEVAA